MTQPELTEAACLLQGGALYHSRVGLVPSSAAADLLFAGFKQGAFSLYFGDEPIYHFDLEGRWQRAYIKGLHYLKSLDTSVRSVDREREGANLVLKRRELSDAEAQAVDTQVRGIALGLLAELDGGRLSRQEPPAAKAQSLDDAGLKSFLERIAAWDVAAWMRHRERFQATYRPLGFLPPDCQNAVVFQATHGTGRGSYFGSDPALDPLIRSHAEFQNHVEEVTRLLGRRLLQTRMAFLASGDVLHQRAQDVLAYLEILGKAFKMDAGTGSRDRSVPGPDDAPKIEGVYAFLDDFSPPCPDLDALRAFRQRHLKHVTLGVESGTPQVRALYHKTWRDDDLRRVVADVKAAGIGLSLVTLVGAGGEVHASSHVRQSAELLASLGLSRGDIVFLLDEKELAGPGREEGDAISVSGAAWIEQQARYKQALMPLRESGVKIVPYSLEKQWA